ncbi:MAG: S-methyl-5-thioribose-1-phosphate isomerase [Candidatus Omnitrophica bacterium]|nr:S-methyl-5-thioribose-1-phosphate isomerase [Candidatus Omnitrophota bacterium]
MSVETIRWKKDRVELIDQRLLPAKLRYISCRSARDMWEAIRHLKVRGAPAIGIAGAYGAYLGVRSSRAAKYRTFKRDLDRTVEYLATARPTARNLFWALEEVTGLVEQNRDKSVPELKKLILEKAHGILEEDNRICRLIGEKGAALIKPSSRVLTHCNAGGLATAGHGTAVSVITAAGKKIQRVYADETRPVLQGARLTVWELTREGVPTTLICDNMAASLMDQKGIDAVVVGADRIASNGDTANKIGTYNLAVLASYHKVPFYVAAPFSTFDLAIPDGSGISIEERAPEEVRTVGSSCVTVPGVDVWNPAFDVTPSKLITAIITEKGVIRAPDRKKIKKVLS